MTLDLLCIGSTSVDTFLLVDDAKVYCDVDTKSCNVSFGFGAKIPVNEIHKSLGGGACNVAAGTSKLGVKTYLYTYVGNDTEGEYVKLHLRKKNILHDYIYTDNKPTNRATVISYSADRTIFTYKKDRDYLVNQFDKVNNIFVCSTSNNVHKLFVGLSELKEINESLKIFYNPGTLELKYAKKDTLRFLKYVDYLILNLDELKTLLIDEIDLTDTNIEHKSSNNIAYADLMQKLMVLVLKQGPNAVIVTDGENGVYYLEKNANQLDVKHIEVKRLKAVEKTGAGDAFTSGFISGILHNLNLESACKWGIKNSASAIMTLGAQEGLLNYEDISK